MCKNKKPTRAELKEYIFNLEKLLFYSSIKKGINNNIPFNLVPKNLPFEFKKQFAKNSVTILYNKEEIEIETAHCMLLCSPRFNQ